MLKKLSRAAALIGLSCLLFGCSEHNRPAAPAANGESRQQLAWPESCGSARRNIRLLNIEKADVKARSLDGAEAVLPFPAVALILGGDYDAQTPVDPSQYGRDLGRAITRLGVDCDVVY